jgi:hypothetical protein
MVELLMLQLAMDGVIVCAEKGALINRIKILADE